jgi:dTDP-4-dehydrorhamnose reductase
MNVAVIGASGQLGSDVADEFLHAGNKVSLLSHGDIEISSLDSVRSVLTGIKPEVIVNTAAMHNVESCEKEPAKAYAVNALGSRNLATSAKECGAILIHVSTDYVFDGSKGEPYLESDPAVPLNVYGNTKLAGELFIRATTDNYVILRTSGLYGKRPCRAKGGLNFVEFMLKLASERDELRVVNDEFVSPTHTLELAKQIVALARSREFGLYHATAEGSCTWYQFAQKIFEFTGKKVNLRIAAPNEFPAKVSRPKYSVLENQRLKALGMNRLQSWESGLESYLASTHRTHYVKTSSAS